MIRGFPTRISRRGPLQAGRVEDLACKILRQARQYYGIAVIEKLERLVDAAGVRWVTIRELRQ